MKAHKKNLDIAVLFIIFNRPEPTGQVFDRIRDAKPSRLYISADGPRHDNVSDLNRCEKARAIVDNIDWPCDLKLLLHEKNLGCGRAIATAIDWFFNEENEGIILEDDCLPEITFFEFCKQLLEIYRNEEKIMHINGNNFNANFKRILNSNDLHTYYFGSFAQAWGWASWRRSWKIFDYNIRTWPKNKGRLQFIKKFPQIGNYLEKALHFDIVYSGRNDIWDYQWQYAVLENDGFVVVPTNNLVSNIGYGADATHLKIFDKKRFDLETHELTLPIDHPPIIKRQIKIDSYYGKHMGMNFKFKNLLKYFISHFNK
jgi:hypothetical protein